MPYITSKSRQQLDLYIDQLADKIVEESKNENYDAAFAGLLNYSCTKLALQVIYKRFGKLRYWLVAIVSGVFNNIGEEFYRRLAAPYENKQIQKNGDVDLYSQFEKIIEQEP
ncbi:MAG: hypothetical protein BWY48_00292 [Parcubacteria group bacterium ADurb.Bin305]|jgi:hypothetical protein|nr:hypothetical protein [Candidatus Paceibacterota bacterium]OQA44049.1 MAG: hypothetical protein BWY48_00292 [Parcubacteria group bacterium ADurb.Bin305]